MKTYGILFLLMATFALSSCSKDKEVTGLDASGYWEGLYAEQGETPSIDFAVLLRSDGTMRLYYDAIDTATADKADGTYSLSGRAITGSYNFTDPILGTYTFSAQVASGDTTMTGNYSGNGSAMGDAGDFILLKQ